MKFLIDNNNLSPVLADLLKAAGHQATHIRDYGLEAATDPVVLARANDEDCVLVSADTDFGTLLAREESTHHRCCSSAGSPVGAQRTRPPSSSRTLRLSKTT